MDTWETMKRKAGRYAVMTLIVMLLSGAVGGFFGGYISFLGGVAHYVASFVAIFLLLIVSDWATKAIFQVD